MESWKLILIALAGAAVLGTGIFATVHMTKATSYSPEVVEAYKAWQNKYNQKESDPDVDAYRLGVFSSNFAKINNHKSTDYKLGQNQFMTLTAAEFKANYLGLLPQQKKMGDAVHIAEGSAPTNVDWTAKGDVSAVKNQGQCGSCWAFSTTGSLEACSAIFGKGLGDFSEQQLVDCSTSEGNMGCNGGLMDYAFKYVIANGITTESAYPYTAVDGKCTTTGGSFKISKYTDVNATVNDLKSAIAQQPVSIGVDAEEWQFYSSGIFNNCGTQLDHGVLAVGYTGNASWLVKNSWGADWGEKGYIRLTGNANTCGILNTASYPSI